MAITNGYATLAEIKAYMSISDTTDDSLLENLVESASRSIDRIANRRFYFRPINFTIFKQTFYTINNGI